MFPPLLSSSMGRAAVVLYLQVIIAHVLSVLHKLRFLNILGVNILPSQPDGQSQLQHVLYFQNIAT